jgi:predicted lipoprotein with Yx(FWY)xxD motif
MTVIVSGLAVMMLAGGCAGGESTASGVATASGALAPAAAAPSPSVTASGSRPAGRGVQIRSLVARRVPGLGVAVTDGKGWVLYRFDKDSAHPSIARCEGTCTQKWMPVLAETVPALTNIPAAQVGWVVRADGGTQVTIGGWPLYRFAGDAKPGQWKGQAIGGIWYAALPSGAKNQHPAKAAGAAAGTKAPPTSTPSSTSKGNGY